MQAGDPPHRTPHLRPASYHRAEGIPRVGLASKPYVARSGKGAASRDPLAAHASRPSSRGRRRTQVYSAPASIAGQGARVPVNPNLARLQSYPFEKLRALFAGVSPNPRYKEIKLSIGEPQHALSLIHI